MLPGDLSEKEKIARIIRVDHAGEYGAKRIYAGQMAVLGDKPVGKVIQHMADQEDRHLAAFNELISERKIRPTALLPLWHVAGFALGAMTALMGEKAAMACTVAVEEVIDQHYEGQEKVLGESDFAEKERDLWEKISKFRAEENEHKQTGIKHGAEDVPGYELLKAGIKGATRLAIWLSERV